METWEVDRRLEGPDFKRAESPDLNPEKANLRLEKINLGTVRGELSPIRAILRSDRAELSIERVESGLGGLIWVLRELTFGLWRLI